MKTLLADDELTSQIILQDILSGCGNVHVCVDGGEVLSEYRRALTEDEPYDLICLDVLMPIMSGLEVLKQIRQEDEIRGRSGKRSTKIIITTGAGDKATVDQAFSNSCDAFITKPINSEDLIAIVQCLFSD